MCSRFRWKYLPAGSLEGELNLSGFIMQSTQKEAYFMRDGFLVKLSPEGDILWTKQYFSYYNVDIKSLVVDHDNNLYILGDYKVKVEFDDITLVTNNTDTLYSKNSFLVKYSPEGELIWSKSTGGKAGIYGNALAVDYDNNLLITGTSIELELYDTPDMISTLDSVLTFEGFWHYFHPYTGFIAKYDGDGNQLWILETGGEPESIKADYDNNILVTGRYNVYGATFGSEMVEPIGSFSGFLTQYDTDGNFNWVRTFGASGNWNSGYDIEVDSSNFIYLTGRIGGANVEFSGEIISDLNHSDGFLARYDATGELIWVHQITQNHPYYLTVGHDITLTQSNEIVFIGMNKGSIYLLGTNFWVGGPNDFDLMILKYDLNGQLINLGFYEGSPHARGKSVAEGLNGELYIAGLAFYQESENGYDALIARVNNLSNIVGVNDASSEKTIALFPNPTSGKINFKLPENFPEIQTINIYTLDGKLVKSLAFEGLQNSLDLEEKGLFFIEIFAGPAVYVQKIMVY